MADTKHALKTKVGLKEKKIEKLQSQLDVEPKSATGESVKESIRMLVSITVGMGVTALYQKYPFLGTLQPDQFLIVTTITSLIFRGAEKWYYQFKKNKHEVGTGVGIDRIFTTFGSLFNKQKTPVVQTEVIKK